MNIICIQHVDFETPGTIEAWANSSPHSFKVIKPYRGEPFPSLEDFDCLISMGGPQSPADAERLPYLRREMDLLRRAVKEEKHVLGFCLGAQLIGEALGGKTKRSPEKEVGVFPVTLTDEGKQDPLFHDFPASFPVIHWHNDMPGSTDSGILLATSEGCPAQAYRYEPRVYGLQFHMEISKQGMEDLIVHVPHDLTPSRFTQSRDELLKQDYTSIHERLAALLDRFISL